VLLQPGSEARADLRVTLRQGHTVRGIIQNLRPDSKADLRLSSGDDDLGLTRSSLELATGQFEIHGVLDGAYRLRVCQRNAQEQLLFAERDVVVGDHDVEGLTLTLASPPAVKRKVRIEGELNNLVRWPSSAMATLYPQDTFSTGEARRGPVVSRELADGTFEIPSVFPGKYWVQFDTRQDAYVSSARAGDRDLLTNQELFVRPDAAPELEVVLRTDGGTVRGSLAAGVEPGKPVVVLLVPESGDRPASARIAATGGGFFFPAVAPGSYRLHVMKGSAEVEFGSPTLLSTLARSGTPVEVKAGEAIDVRIQKISEELK
jgi:hypothetical protein